MTRSCSVATTVGAEKVVPPSWLLRTRISIWSVSLPVNLRASQKARIVPRAVTSNAGMRYLT